MNELEHLGKLAFEAWNRKLGIRAPWDVCLPEVKAAWIEAAGAVRMAAADLHTGLSGPASEFELEAPTG